MLKKIFNLLTNSVSVSISDSDKKMKFLKVKNGEVEVYNEQGQMLFRFSINRDAISADYNSNLDLIAVTTNKGTVQICNGRGGLLYTIGNRDAVNAKWIDDNVAITTNKGTTEIRTKDGGFIRFF